ncbi:RAD51-associated protein 1 isoform X2 [Hoplias malabaricus]|uniref:RAD51-associated protein 1 isoform X2 n=1 Tax=Hoplias malabaricus TaxID=27720 RepID=UPI0034636B15
MDRPSRSRKTVNYTDLLDDDDEDFATAKAPPTKKARASTTESINSAKGIIDLTGKGCQERVSLDEKLYKRDLEAALSLSLLRNTEKPEEHSPKAIDVKCEPPVLTHCSVDGSCLDIITSNHPPRDSPPVLSNCSVDVSCLGLDQITSEQTLSPETSRKRKASKSNECQKRVVKDSAEDEDYKPQNTPESESDFSEPDESEDEEFTVKRKGNKKKTSKSEKKTAPKPLKKERSTPKQQKAKPQPTVGKSALCRSPGVAQSIPATKRSPITPPTHKPALCSSPASGRLPKWNPPGLLRSSPTFTQSGPVKSPGMGLRLGLSRLARIKPLHPNAAAH